MAETQSFIDKSIGEWRRCLGAHHFSTIYCHSLDGANLFSEDNLNKLSYCSQWSDWFIPNLGAIW